MYLGRIVRLLFSYLEPSDETRNLNRRVEIRIKKDGYDKGSEKMKEVRRK